MIQYQISKTYPSGKYNLLGNTDIMVEIPDIKSPVVQVVKLSPNTADEDVYFEKRTKLLAITKNGLKKLADGAGIKMISSRHVVPTTCQKCAAVHAASHSSPQCWNCQNKDVAYCVTIAVPQLTGEVITVEDTHEIIVENVTNGMTVAQKAEFMKHLPQICEAKALNGAIRTALHIKSGYTAQELSKPFVVAYLVPNLNNPQVKAAAIDAMFASSRALFGSDPAIEKAPDVAMIEGKVPNQEPMAIEAADGENYDQYIDGTYDQQPAEQPAPQPTVAAPQPQPVQAQEYPPAQQEAPQVEWHCCQCGVKISDKVYKYSRERFGRALCYNCQRGAQS